MAINWLTDVYLKIYVTIESVTVQSDNIVLMYNIKWKNCIDKGWIHLESEKEMLLIQRVIVFLPKYASISHLFSADQS